VPLNEQTSVNYKHKSDLMIKSFIIKVIKYHVKVFFYDQHDKTW